MIISSKLKNVEMDNDTRKWFMQYEHQKINLPDKFIPDKKFIEYHNDMIFQGQGSGKSGQFDAGTTA